MTKPYSLLPNSFLCYLQTNLHKVILIDLLTDHFLIVVHLLNIELRVLVGDYLL